MTQKVDAISTHVALERTLSLSLQLLFFVPSVSSVVNAFKTADRVPTIHAERAESRRFAAEMLR
jgi:hypothetical protein